MEVKQAYEVYSLIGGGYGKRHLHGYAWTKLDAQRVAGVVDQGKYHIGMVHLVKIADRWHRIHVIPIENIAGNLEEAEVSRIATNDIPKRHPPAMNYQIDSRQPCRLSLDLAKSIDTMASYDPESDCKLSTLRTGGKLPLTFKIRDLRNSEHTQKQVVAWLTYEINFRNEQGVK